MCKYSAITAFLLIASALPPANAASVICAPNEDKFEAESELIQISGRRLEEDYEITASFPEHVGNSMFKSASLVSYREDDSLLFGVDIFTQEIGGRRVSKIVIGPDFEGKPFVIASYGDCTDIRKSIDPHNKSFKNAPAGPDALAGAP